MTDANNCTSRRAPSLKATSPFIIITKQASLFSGQVNPSPVYLFYYYYRRIIIATSSKPGLGPDDIKELVITSLDDNKAEDIVCIDLQGKTAIADFMVVASGRSGRQISALAEKLVETLHKEGLVVRIEGKQSGDWVLLDAGDIIVHLFRPEVRSFYDLEKMWDVDFSKANGGLHLTAH